MNLYKEVINRNEAISIVGLGYVGMPIAVAFAKKVKVIGFDLNSDKVKQYMSGQDPTNEVGNAEISKTSVLFTSNPEDLRKAKFHIVAVPTPVSEDHTPNLEPLKSASKIVGENLVKGSIVVFESTVYPGVTEEICVPILEKYSGLECGLDFKVGYSPERINPGDKIHRLENIVKVVSGMDKETLEIVAKIYELVVDVGVHKAQSIKVAEAAKVIENSQRDINIAFMNELSIIFKKMDIDTKSVLEAAGTKWNFLNFYPGLVGGHCIGVDPYYLTYKAEELGYHSQIILAGRRINDSMGKEVAQNAIKLLIKNGVNVSNSRVGVFGFTFKEDCPDVRNTKVIDIVSELREYGVEPLVYDPIASIEDVNSNYSIRLKKESEMVDLDLSIVAVGHKEFSEEGILYWEKRMSKTKIMMDLKGIFEMEEFENRNIKYWRL
ncbi:nucleotide sugar dehydrogenase [Vagococcus fluvialis]|uniref:nucleotide sugar dehydrogenase n=1 Tax=Vagococcus fluvialis TaxID=2738 RepID=UPI003D117A87